MANEHENAVGAQLLAALRQQAGLTQIELAQRADISRSMVAQLEGGERRPSRQMLRLLCRAFNASEEEEQRLLAAYAFLPPGDTSDQIVALLRADRNLTYEQVERLGRFIREAYANELNYRVERSDNDDQAR